ncbi:MAG: hypothetical protein JRC77_01660 [Deltaproteobacteria bacterium]|nr:hypothetical protein [Deltaproteobacteria bacterium]
MLQILAALVRNGVESVSAMEETVRRVAVGARQVASGKVVIEIEDNGMGIAEGDKTRIFAFGFTTKQEHDGIGLHTAALAAEILGGSLEVSSKGPRCGATFSLIVPMNCAQADENRDLGLSETTQFVS